VTGADIQGGNVFQQILSGLEAGSWYALLAVAIVIVMKATDVPNFAQAQIGMPGAFIAVNLIGLGWPSLLAMAVGIACGFVIGAVIERLAIRPLAALGHFPMLVMTIGLTYALVSLVTIVFGSEPRLFPAPWGKGAIEFWGLYLPYAQVVTIVVGVILAFALAVFFRTTWGVRMRAISENPGVSRLLGINSGRVSNLAWGLGAAISTLAMMLHTQGTVLADSSADPLILKAFVAAVLGSFTSLTGAFIGGLSIGVLENLTGMYIGTGWKDAVALVIVVVYLFVRMPYLVKTIKPREV
jgi:branched-chain amino acid transport system permease protein